jgi:hypothetical protein
LLVWGLIAEPVVVPGVVFDLVTSVAALLPFDAPGAGCICADATAVTPNNAAITRAEMASLERMAISSLDHDDAGVRTCHADLGSGRASTISRKSRRLMPAARDLCGAAFRSHNPARPRIKSEGALSPNCAGDLEGQCRPSTQIGTTCCRYFWSLFLVASPLLEWWLIPVVVLDFILLVLVL